MGSRAENRTILIVTSQPLPAEDRPTTGGALRAWALGQALKGCGFTVHYSVPFDESSENSEHREYAHQVSDLGAIIASVAPDVVLFCNWGLAVEAAECAMPTVIDMNGSLILENHFRGRRRQLDDCLAKIEAIGKADYLLAGSAEQRDYLLGWCLMAGISPEKIRIGVVPFSLSPDCPAATPAQPGEFVMAGYAWPWLRSEERLRQLCRVLEESQKGHLDIYCGKSPYVDNFQHENSAKDEGGEDLRELSPRLTLHAPVSFPVLGEKLARGGVAVDLWAVNAERELAVSSRVIAYLWAGLPVLTNSGTVLGRLIERYQAGWIVDPLDDDALARIVGEILALDPTMLARYRENSRRLFLDHFCWAKTITPLAEFCSDPQLNRSDATLPARYLYYRHLAENLERHVDDRQKKLQHVAGELEARAGEVTGLSRQVERLARENERLWRVHRRPQGLAVMQNPAGLWRSMRRLVIGVPVLFYLTGLTLAGHCLHLLQMRMNRR